MHGDWELSRIALNAYIWKSVVWANRLGSGRNIDLGQEL